MRCDQSQTVPIEIVNETLIDDIPHLMFLRNIEHVNEIVTLGELFPSGVGDTLYKYSKAGNMVTEDISSINCCFNKYYFAPSGHPIATVKSDCSTDRVAIQWRSEDNAILKILTTSLISSDTAYYFHSSGKIRRYWHASMDDTTSIEYFYDLSGRMTTVKKKVYSPKYEKGVTESVKYYRWHNNHLVESTEHRDSIQLSIMKFDSTGFPISRSYFIREPQYLIQIKIVKSMN